VSIVLLELPRPIPLPIVLQLRSQCAAESSACLYFFRCLSPLWPTPRSPIYYLSSAALLVSGSFYYATMTLDAARDKLAK
jgi:hypothetical protein